MMTTTKIWKKVGVRNGRPVLFSYLVFPQAASVAEALDAAFPWDGTAQGDEFWLSIYDKLSALATPAVAWVPERPRQ